ncbi:hypothetical protein EH171_02555 [Enterovibrio baiacu]|nr:hypothetical protein [Enterovibrio baiacu]
MLSEKGIENVWVAGGMMQSCVTHTEISKTA